MGVPLEDGKSVLSKEERAAIRAKVKEPALLVKMADEADRKEKKLNPDALVETANKLRLQACLLNEAGKFSMAKLAAVVIKKHNLVSYLGRIWQKDGYVLHPTNVQLRNTLALQTLFEFGAEDNWGRSEQSDFETYISGMCNTVIKTPPEHWLFTANAVIDLETLEVIEPGPEYAVINALAAKYDPAARCRVLLEGFEKAFSKIHQEAFLSIFGARLNNSLKQKTFVVLSGEGNQSKGTWKDVIGAIFGKRMSHDDIKFTKDKFRAKSFVGTCIIWNSETDKKHDTERLIKDITGGATLALETKGKDEYGEVDYNPIVVIDTNKPPSPSLSPAMRTRLQWFPLTGHFVRQHEMDKHVGDPTYFLMTKEFNDHYLDSEEISGFLNLLLPYAQYWTLNNDYKVEAEKDLEKMVEVSDSVVTFIDNFVHPAHGQHLYISNVYKYYCEFCSKTGTEPQKRFTLEEVMRRIGGRNGPKRYQWLDVAFDIDAFNFYRSYGEMPPEMPETTED